MVMIMRMAKPEEVLVVEVDGEVIRQKISHEVDSIELYNLMRETLGTPTFRVACLLALCRFPSFILSLLFYSTLHVLGQWQWRTLHDWTQKG